MKELEYLAIYFERHNSKYNRIWEQLTTISLFFIATLVAFYVFRSDLVIQLLNNKITATELLIKEQITYLYLGVLAIIIFAGSYLFSELVKTRQIVKSMFNKHKLNY